MYDFNDTHTFIDLTKQELVHGSDRPKSHIIRVIEGFETVMFRSKFDSWPQTTDVAVSEDGRGKVAGQLLKYFLDKFALSILYPSLRSSYYHDYSSSYSIIIITL